MSCPEGLSNIGAAKPGDAGQSGTTSTSEGKCCWCENFSKVVTAKANEKYYNDSAAPPKHFASTKKFQIDVRLKSLEVIWVVTAKFVNVDGVNSEIVEKLKKDWKDKAVKQWDTPKYKLQVIDPECGKRDLRIRFVLMWTDHNAHISVECTSTKVRAAVTGLRMDISTLSTSWTFSHEMGHVLGLPDEYTDPPGKGRTVAYRKPDRTYGKTILKRVDGVDTAHGANIMGAQGKTDLMKEHFWPLAIEVQELLNSELRKGITCDIV